MLESHRLAEDGRLRLGWANGLVSLALGLALRVARRPDRRRAVTLKARHDSGQAAAR
jgi:hypothetical protein